MAKTPQVVPQGECLIKLPTVLALTTYSRTRWYAGVKSGEFPKPLKLGPRSVAWKRSDVDQLINTLAGKQGGAA